MKQPGFDIFILQNSFSIITGQTIDRKEHRLCTLQAFFIAGDRNNRLLSHLCQKILCCLSLFTQNAQEGRAHKLLLRFRTLNVKHVVINGRMEFIDCQFERFIRHIDTLQKENTSACYKRKLYKQYKPKRQQEVARVGEVTVKQLFGDVGQREALFLHGAIVDLDGIDKSSRASGGVDPYLLFALQVNYGHTGAFRNTDDIPHGKGLSAAQEAMYREGISGVFDPPEAEDEEQPCRDHQKHKCQNERDAGRSPNNADQTSGGRGKKRRDWEGQCVIYGVLPLAVGDQGNDGPDAQGDPKDKECCYFDAPPVVWS